MPHNVWDDVPDWGGGIGAVRLDRAGSLGASVWELAPGVSQALYHFHHSSEELLVVLAGTPTVRTHEGDRRLGEGDVLSFPRGPAGGHEIRNDGTDTARVLIVSTNASPDVAEYPETGKVAYVLDGVHHFHRVRDAVEHAFPDE